jgi:hypothetical protein
MVGQSWPRQLDATTLALLRFLLSGFQSYSCSRLRVWRSDSQQVGTIAKFSARALCARLLRARRNWGLQMKKNVFRERAWNNSFP